MDNSTVVSERAPSPASRPAPTVAGRDETGSESLSTGDGQYPWGNFHLATVMFRRAVQLKQGARPRVETGGHKLVHVAFLEVTAGAIPWEASFAPSVDDRR